MESYNIKRLTKSLALKRKIVGIKFITYRQEFEEIAAEVPTGKMYFCRMVHRASQGVSLKATGIHFGCTAAGQTLGILDEPEMSRSARVYKELGLYESFSIAKQVHKSVEHIKHKIYGVLVAPLEEIHDADSVIIICNARQVMRIMQGYAYKFGTPNNLLSVGNQAVCSDLVAKPFVNNDINMSFMCRGARQNTESDDGEMGVGFPIQMFNEIAEGVLITLNLVERNEVKDEILQTLTAPNELGIDIEYDASYAKNLDLYKRYASEMEENEGEYYR